MSSATSGDASSRAVRVEIRADGVAIVWIDEPGESVNTITEAFGGELERAMSQVYEDAAVVGAVLASRKKDFVVGAHIDMLTALPSPAAATAKAKQLAAALDGLRKKPTVAAVHGQALGGGLEIALACSAIVVSDDPKTGVGFPEVQLGLLPGANGLLRASDRIGLAGALDLGLTGRTVRAKKAKAMGLVDEVCPEAVLIEVAARRVRDLGESKRDPRKHGPHGKSDLTKMLLENNPVGRAVLFKKARSAANAKARGNYPAIPAILQVLETYGAKGWNAAAEVEARRFGELVFSPESRALVSIFRAVTALKKDPGISPEEVASLPKADRAELAASLPKADRAELTASLPKAESTERIAVIGGGLMGGGIAFVSMQKGVDVRLKDRDDAGVGRGLSHVKKLFGDRVKKKRMPEEAARSAWGHLSSTTDYSGFGRTEVVIEAVFEELSLKRKVLAEVEAVTNEECIFATNTSSLPIEDIAAGSKRPERVIGMHYFSPVEKMPLLEIVRAQRTAPEVVAKCVALGKRQGKTVIVVNDGTGFYTTRVLAPYLNEAAYLLTEGVAIETIDRALVAWGFPVGPIQLIDEVGIDVGAHVGMITTQAFGERMAPPGPIRRLLEDERKGKKNHRGFYKYDEKGKRQGVDPSIYPLLGIEPTHKPGDSEIQMRCSLAFVNEAIRAYGDGILRSARDGDIGAIFGLGFPPFRGGPFHWVDAEGAEKVLSKLRAYEQRFGTRFEPAPMLVELAARGGTFYDVPRPR